MDVNGVETGYVAGYSYTYQVSKAENKTTDPMVKLGDEVQFSKNVIKCTQAGNQKVMLCSDALMSYASPETGESVNIYKAEKYAKDNPVYIIKGLDANGTPYEQEIDARKINPSHCSYNEMMVLNLETGHTSPKDYLHMAAVRAEAGTGSYFEKADYLACARKVRNDMQMLGDWTSYLPYDKWIGDILKYRNSNQGAVTAKSIEQTEKEVDVSQKTDQQDTDYQSFLKKKINEIFVKIQNGETEPSYQIGSQSFTIKEWEEFLMKFDSVQEAFRELQQEEFAKREEEAVQEVMEKKDDVSDAKIDMLVSETVSARFPLQKLDKDGNKQYDQYLIAIDKNGIRCSKPGQDTYEWQIIFSDEKQYEKASGFLDFAGEHMDNMLFAAHENFWEDYLNDNMDVEAFQEFLMGTNNGLPDYSITIGDSMYIDKEKVQWTKYMNPLNARFYTAEEMHQMQEELMAKNTANKTKITDSYAEIYKKTHPNYHGERIFCEYPGGPLYTADEIMDVMLQNAKDLKYQAEARKSKRA